MPYEHFHELGRLPALSTGRSWPMPGTDAGSASPAGDPFAQLDLGDSSGG